jgi:hypothetical protein
VSLGPYLVRGALREDADELLWVGEDAVLGRAVWLRVVPEGGPALPAWRRALARPTRLPWLTGGKQGGWAWDAFLAPQGCPLANLVDPRAPMPWAALRPLLLQLADELAAACADGSLPRPLSAARVWVAPGGRVQLLDGPPPGVGPGEESDESGDAARALGLLRRVAALALEGWQGGKAPGEPVHAPVPARVALVLDRLTGAEDPYTEVEQFQSDLIALQSEPTDVDAATRSGHLALLVAVLSPVLLLMLGARYLAMQHTLKDLLERVTALRAAADGLVDAGRREDLRAAVRDSPALRGTTLEGWRVEVGKRLGEDTARLAALRKSVQWDWLTRFLLPEPYWRGDAQTTTAGSFGPAELERAARLTRQEPGAAVDAELRAVYGLIVVPALGCVLWALATRGGFTFRLMGISLCRASGRRALRVQCAWRALLFWAPVVTFLCLSVWVQIHLPGRPALAFGLWASAVGVVAGYMLLAIWFPTRSLHDRLAGTYLVPK